MNCVACGLKEKRICLFFFSNLPTRRPYRFAGPLNNGGSGLSIWESPKGAVDDTARELVKYILSSVLHASIVSFSGRDKALLCDTYIVHTLLLILLLLMYDNPPL